MYVGASNGVCLLTARFSLETHTREPIPSKLGMRYEDASGAGACRFHGLNPFGIDLP